MPNVKVHYEVNKDNANVTQQVVGGNLEIRP
jgi:hypothetical protein